ncbi:YbjQ family protein [Paracoccus yeei]|uniref:YbjQ family protein n=1 Tax=Paracoccus yeei TaxID=147645 RepID=UPI001CD4140E
MAVCAACANEDIPVDPVSLLCRSCQDELGVPYDATEEPTPISAPSIILTTEATSNLKVTKRLGIVSAECVIGQNIFKDVAASFRDLFGGRSKTMQNGLRDAKNTVLQELAHAASDLRADAVVGVQFHYASIGGAGSVNMLLLTVTGTAVKLTGSDRHWPD